MVGSQGGIGSGGAAYGTTHVEQRLWKKEVLLVSRPTGLPTEDNFEVRQSELVFTRPPSPGSVVLKVLWLSLDPYIRTMMHEDNGLTDLPSLELGQPIMTMSIGKVMASGNPEFKEGDIARAYIAAADYAILPAGYFSLAKIDHTSANIPLTHYLGVLGLPGLTAWVGLNIITQLQAWENVYISAAAGAVGLIAGQLAKLKGCRVVGSAGSDEKVKMLKEVYNFDEAFNYKTEKDLSLALKRYFPDGFDVYFENVGGDTLEAALDNIRRKGRIVACGMISEYSKDHKDRKGARNLMKVIGKSLRMEGFLVGDYTTHEYWSRCMKEIEELLWQGKIKYQEHVLGRGIEEFPKAFVGMLKGDNSGKAVLLVNEY